MLLQMPRHATNMAIYYYASHFHYCSLFITFSRRNVDKAILSFGCWMNINRYKYHLKIILATIFLQLFTELLIESVVLHIYFCIM